MEKYIDGLFLYEILLMALGALLFLALIILLLIKKEIKWNHLVGFIIAIIAIGFPGIQSFSISKEMIKIERYTLKLEENPDNETVQKELEAEISKVESRPLNSADHLVTLSKAKLVLGEETQAEELSERALEKDSANVEALEVQQIIRVQKSILEVQKNAADERALKMLEKNVRRLQGISTKSAKSTVRLAEGYEALGNAEKARKYLDSTKLLQPKNVKIQPLERKLLKRTAN